MRRREFIAGLGSAGVPLAAQAQRTRRRLHIWEGGLASRDRVGQNAEHDNTGYQPMEQLQ